MARQWQDEEIEYLKRFGGSKSLNELARRFSTKASEVSTKLAELGQTSSGAEQRRNLYQDPLVETYGKALEKLQAGKWKDAAKDLEKVIEGSDIPELTERARQMLQVTVARLVEDGKAGDVDPFLVAVYEKNRGNVEESLALCTAKGRDKKDERFAFLAASCLCLAERFEDAAETLERAIEQNPKNRVYAFHDSDFAELLQQPEYAHLFGLGG